MFYKHLLFGDFTVIYWTLVHDIEAISKYYSKTCWIRMLCIPACCLIRWNYSVPWHFLIIFCLKIVVRSGSCLFCKPVAMKEPATYYYLEKSPVFRPLFDQPYAGWLLLNYRSIFLRCTVNKVQTSNSFQLIPLGLVIYKYAFFSARITS